MDKKATKFIISAIVTVGLFWVLSMQIGSAPPLGSFLNPNSGFWANAQTQKNSSTDIALPDEQLSDSVNVYFDDHQIPHVFANNKQDLYFAQGYITARDRLWQMELQTRAAAGRLSEILGDRTLQYDRYQRHIGMIYAAEQAREEMLSNPQTARAVKAYASGVNAWINSLEPSNYPLEYKVLDYSPEKWTPLKTALLLKNMTYTLAGYNADLRMSNTRAFMGDSFIQNVLNLRASRTDPTIPRSKEWNFDADVPQKPDTDFTPSIVDTVSHMRPDPTNGSNNWAVSGSKTASGYPILANDPHLNLTLPSIWYAMQLHGPNQNAMGVTLPGAPAIIVGFNEDVAWGTTNVGADVWDWYEINFRDSMRSEYRYDGQWKSTEKRVEKIKVKGQPAVIDTVVYTHYGPVTQTSGDEPLDSDVPKYHAMRWIAYEKSDELQYFMNINKAEDYEDYRQALRHYDSPAQNWVFADSSDIALTVTGKYPKKWEGQGRFISDGSDPAYEWQGWIPFEQIPFVKNPDRGFVSSANQLPTDSTYPFYLDRNFAPYERGRRINDLLESMDDIRPKDMQKMQMDAFSYHAKTMLPKLLQKLNTDSLSSAEEKALAQLRDWDYKNKGELLAPSIFDYWWDKLYGNIWYDEYNRADVALQWPGRDQTAQLVLQDSTLEWYNNVNTSEKETLTDLINQSFHQAIEKLNNEYGSYGEDWKWGYVNNIKIGHLGQLPGMGDPKVFVDGGAESVNASHGSHGPSWRMVVQLGPEIEAWGIYPGGQSGNPGSKHYDDMVDEWSEGKLFKLNFMREAPASADSVQYSITLN